MDDAVEGLLVAASLVQVGVRDGADGEAREDVEEAVDVAKGDLGELVDVGGRDLARLVDVELVDHGPEVLGLVLANVNIAVVCFLIVSAWLCAHGELCAPKIASTRLNVWGPEPRGDGRLREVWRGRQ